MRQPAAPPVAVLDTSVLVPAWSRVTLQLLASGAAPRYQPVWSEWIIAETWRVLTDRLVPPDRRFSLDEMAEGLAETIQLAFEPEDTPSPKVVEEATRSFLQLFDQFINALQQRNQRMEA